MSRLSGLPLSIGADRDAPRAPVGQRHRPARSGLGKRQAHRDGLARDRGGHGGCVHPRSGARRGAHPRRDDRGRARRTRRRGRRAGSRAAGLRAGERGGGVITPLAPSALNNPAPDRPLAVTDHDSTRSVISDLCTLLATYLEPTQVEDVRRACDFAATAHAGQQRASGEPYVEHPIAVARILAEKRMDHESIMAAILHDVIEDTPTAKDQLATQFGAEVAELVDGVSKLTQIRFSSMAEAQAENFRMMMLAMVRDIRVILVKLADRLHIMRTVNALPPAKRRRIARETLEIYVPIAHRLGMNAIRLELEDMGFAGLYPQRHRVLAEAVKKARGNRKEIVAKIQVMMAQRLAAEGLPTRVVGREKHLYSIYLKMRQKALLHLYLDLRDDLLAVAARLLHRLG